MNDHSVEKKVDIIERSNEYKGFFRLERLVLSHSRFNGGMTRPIAREVMHIGPAVVVLPYDPALDQIVMIEQFRCGAMQHPGGPWMLEAPAGLGEQDEAAIDTAVRELREECGLATQAIEAIGSYAATPGAVNERADLFIAKIDSKAAGGVHGLPHEDEDIRSIVIAADTAFEWLESGRIVAANAVISLRWLQVHRDDLRRRWQ